MKLNWTKLPSVTRKGKFFYRATREETTYTVVQSFLCGQWQVQDNHGAVWGQFTTAKQAMRAVETMA